MKSFLVIGLGRFGEAVARELADQGQEVLAIDAADERVQQVADAVTQAICADASDENVLRTIGVRNFDCCIVGVATDMESSILITVLLKELGVKNIVAKAKSAVHARVLERVGADKVVLPESDMGHRLARKLIHTNVVDYFGMAGEYTILEMQVPPSWVGKTLMSLQVRVRHRVNILAIREDGQAINVTPSPNRALGEKDILLLIGANEDAQKVVELS